MSLLHSYAIITKYPISCSPRRIIESCISIIVDSVHKDYCGKKRTSLENNNISNVLVFLINANTSLTKAILKKNISSLQLCKDN